MVAAPVWAQVTTSGLSGTNACFGGYSQNQLAAFDSSNNQANATNTSVNFKLSLLVNWGSIRGLMGLSDTPVTSVTVYGKVKNTRTGADVGSEINFGTLTSSQTNASYSNNNITLTEKTPYALIIYTDYSGKGESNPIAVQCFMTGGTYNVPSGAFSGGCFKAGDSFDVKNCLCGRASLAQTAVTHGSNSPAQNLIDNMLAASSGANQGQPGHTDSEARGRLSCR